MSKKKKSIRYTCPVCNTSYPSRRMALYCNKRGCQHMVAMPKETMQQWKAEAYTACCIEHIMVPLSKGAFSDQKSVNLASKILLQCDRIFHQCRKYGVYESHAIQQRGFLQKTLITTWNKTTELEIPHLLFTLHTLCDDVLTCVADANKPLWERVQQQLTEFITYLDTLDGDSGAVSSNGDYTTLRRFIYGGDAAPEPKAYDILGRFVVVAQSRAEAINHVRMSCGLVVTSAQISGMDSGTKLESATGANAGTVGQLVEDQLRRGEALPFILTMQGE